MTVVWVVLGVLAVALCVVVSFVLVMWLRWVGYHRHTGQPPPVAGMAVVPMLVAEMGALVVAGWWHVRDPWADGRRAFDVARGRPVVCVHGMMQNATNYFGLRRELAAAGRPSEGVALGYPPRTIDRYAEVLAARLYALVAEREGTVDIVCHSMGGLVLRRVLDEHPALRDRIGVAVTVATPHRGTAVTRGARRLPEARMMARRKGGWKELPALSALLGPERVVTIGSTADLTVYPEETTRDPAARHVQVDFWGHASLLIYRAPRRLVLEALGVSAPQA